MSYHQLEAVSAARIREILSRPMSESEDMLGMDGEFDPWDIFPSIYGSYSSEFDKCALDVLCDLRDDTHLRSDLASEIIREMLCVDHLCAYGTSPRVCFPTQEFRELLPELIAKWRRYTILAWGSCP